jgi:UDP-N-acetylenolpyruvoylglucosamine reductase
MTLSPSLSRELRSIAGVHLWTDAPLAPFTTIGTGGKADLLVTVTDTQAVVEALGLLEAHSVPWVCLGAGSNLLVADEGYQGAVVKLDKAFQYVEGLPVTPPIEPQKVVVTVGAGASLARLAAVAAEVGLAGLEFACGIPGSVGGGVAMNAGAYDCCLADVVLEVEMASASGARWVSGTEMGWGYRRCCLPARVVITAVRFGLTPDNSAAILERHRSILRRRRTVQPQGARTFGSTFKNPSGGAAGRLLEAAGLKGEHWGGAEVSRVHANFLVNLGDATTADVLALMSLMRQRVERTCGVLLEPEVRLLGAGFPWEASDADPQGLPESDG